MFLLKQMHLTISSAKWRSFFLGLKVLWISQEGWHCLLCAADLGCCLRLSHNSRRVMRHMNIPHSVTTYIAYIGVFGFASPSYTFYILFKMEIKLIDINDTTVSAQGCQRLIIVAIATTNEVDCPGLHQHRKEVGYHLFPIPSRPTDMKPRKYRTWF